MKVGSGKKSQKISVDPCFQTVKVVLLLSATPAEQQNELAVDSRAVDR
jgi:hypothetical protein